MVTAKTGVAKRMTGLVIVDCCERMCFCGEKKKLLEEENQPAVTELFASPSMARRLAGETLAKEPLHVSPRQ